MKPRTSSLLFSLFLFLPAAVSAAPLEIKEILKTDKGWSGDVLPGYGAGKAEMRVVKFTLAPGAKTPVHMHPLHGAGYVMSGALTMVATHDPHGSFADPAKVKTITVKAGEAWSESVHVWHYGENKGDTPVEFVVVFAGEENVPSSMSVK